jgi:hypothetical protein
MSTRTLIDFPCDTNLTAKPRTDQHAIGARVADFLGHTSIDTTTLYAKVDLNALSRVALPWPVRKEVRS